MARFWLWHPTLVSSWEPSFGALHVISGVEGPFVVFFNNGLSITDWCRWSFNLTLLIAGIFGLVAGASPNFVTLASLLAAVGIGVGGTFCPVS